MSKKLASALIFILCFQVLFSYALAYEWNFRGLRGELDSYARRIDRDLAYTGGKWNTQAYLADPQTPHPSGSSGFLRPLYIAGTDGFVIERSNPITGYLDASDMKPLLTYQRIQTLESITNERWRVVSKPIMYGGQIQGVIEVAYFNPRAGELSAVDQQLTQNIEYLSSLITYSPSRGLDVSRVDVRSVNYDISFEVVSRFNKILINNGRTPSFIDASYVADEMTHPEYDFVTDSHSHERYVIHRRAIVRGGSPVGIIITTSSMQGIYDTLNAYLLISGGTMLLIVLPLAYVAYDALRRERRVKNGQSRQIEKISFDKKASELVINERHIAIPYASNQYYLLDAVIAHPTRRYEHDELLEHIGDSDGSARTIYDAMLAINKKAGIRLVDYQDKTYSVNATYQSAISRG